MQKPRTRFTGCVLSILGLGQLASAQTVPVPVTGYIQDSITIGLGSVISSATINRDNRAVGNHSCFVAADLVGPTGATPVTTPVTNGIRSGATYAGSTGTSMPTMAEPSDAAALTYKGSSFCQTSGGTAVPTFSTAGGTFSGTPGLVINPTTGIINLGSSTVGAHTVRYTSAGFYPTTTTAALTLAVAPAATIAYSTSTYCQAATNPVPKVTPAGGTFTGTPGLVINATTGTISLAQSTPGFHTITYALADACATPASTTIRIDATAPPIFYNVITPNGDAKNDYLTISLPGVTGYEIQIVNRWGKRVWQSNDPNAQWAADGNPAGMYYYWVRFSDCSGQTQTHRSWVEVIK